MNGLKFLFLIFINCLTCNAFQLNTIFNKQELDFLNLSNEFNYNICKESESKFKLKSLKLTPEVPEKGKMLNIEINGVLLKNLNKGAKLKVVVKYQRIRLLNKIFDLCEELDKTENSPIKCPIESGEKIWKYSVEIPNNIPNGMFNIDALITNELDEVFVCTTINLRFDENLKL